MDTHRNPGLALKQFLNLLSAGMFCKLGAFISSLPDDTRPVFHVVIVHFLISTSACFHAAQTMSSSLNIINMFFENVISSSLEAFDFIVLAK